jgi:MerR family copper efflux transcriptional regulator
MNISQLAKIANVSTDTVRYYEKQGLISAPRAPGQRLPALHAGSRRGGAFCAGCAVAGVFVGRDSLHTAQLAQGKFGRADIEHQLQTKMAQIDAHIEQLQTLKNELASTLLCRLKLLAPRKPLVSPAPPHPTVAAAQARQ